MKEEISYRECGMMPDIGGQGVGKTYQKMHFIKRYVTDDFKTKVMGRKCLIYDVNGEYTKEQFERNGIPNFNPRPIALKDVEAWCKSNVVECRKIDAKSLGIKEKKKVLEYLLKACLNILLIVEDPNAYILSITHMEEIVGGLVNLRHKGVDVSPSFQSLRAVEPRIFANSRWFKLFYQSDSISDVVGKVPSPTLWSIAQLIINNRYYNGDKRLFIYIYKEEDKIEGMFTKAEFKKACKQFLSLNKKYVKEYENINSCSTQEAIEGVCARHYQMYYGNADK